MTGAEDDAAVTQEQIEDAYERYVISKPLPAEHDRDGAECHHCGEPWNGGEDWDERYVPGNPEMLGETWKYECPGCGHETFEVGT